MRSVYWLRVLLLQYSIFISTVSHFLAKQNYFCFLLVLLYACAWVNPKPKFEICCLAFCIFVCRLKIVKSTSCRIHTRIRSHAIEVINNNCVILHKNRSESNEILIKKIWILKKILCVIAVCCVVRCLGECMRAVLQIIYTLFLVEAKDWRSENDSIYVCLSIGCCNGNGDYIAVEWCRLPW